MLHRIPQAPESSTFVSMIRVAMLAKGMQVICYGNISVTHIPVRCVGLTQQQQPMACLFPALINSVFFTRCIYYFHALLCLVRLC